MSLNKNIFYTFLVQFPTFFLGIISSIFVVRILGPEGKGIHAIFHADIQLFSLILGFSLNIGLAYFVAKGTIALKKLLGMSLYVLILGSIIAALALFLLFYFASEHLIFPKQYDTLFYIGFLFASFFLTLLNTIFTGILQGMKRFKSINFVAVFNSVLSVLVFGTAFLCSYKTEIKVSHILALGLLVLSCNSLIWIYFYGKHVRVKPTLIISPSQDVRPFLDYLGPVHLSHLVNFFNYRLDMWIINHYCTPAQLGYYSLAVNIVQLMSMISAPISTVLMPYLTSGRWEEKTAMMKRFSKLNISTVAAVSLLIAATCGWVIPFVYGEDFSPSVLPLRILLIGMAFSCFIKPFTSFIASENRVKLNLTATIIGLCFTVALDLWLIPRYDIIGASIASTTAYLSIAFFVFYSSFRKLGLPLGNYAIVTKTDVRQLIRKINHGRSD